MSQSRLGVASLPEHVHFSLEFSMTLPVRSTYFDWPAEGLNLAQGHAQVIVPHRAILVHSQSIQCRNATL